MSEFAPVTISCAIARACAWLSARWTCTRRDVRDFTNWGNTQLKVHLGRLVEMEYVLAHRGGVDGDVGGGNDRVGRQA